MTDMVKHPAHYMNGQKELIDIMHELLTPEEFTGAMKFNIINYTDYLKMHLAGEWEEGAH